MTKQEFLAFSLPYKLFFIIEYGSTNQPTGIYQMSGVYETSVVEGFNYDNNVKTDKLKPILHPLSDLTKEIEHNGEKFVPMTRLKLLYEFESDNVCEIRMHIDYVWTTSIIQLPFDLVMQLISWHFDICGLIGKDEAIDVNTLNENPYK